MKYFLSFFFFCASFFPSSVFGLGVSPSVVVIEDALPSSDISRSIVLSRTDTSTEEKIDFFVEGNGASAIIIPEELVFLPGENTLSFDIGIAPKNFSTGSYDATVQFLPEEFGGAIGGTEIQTAVSMKLQFSVTQKKKKDLLLSQVNIYPVEKNNWEIFYTIENRGNVADKPARIEIDFVDSVDQSKKSSYTIAGDAIPEVAEFDTKQYSIQAPLIVESGVYNTKISFYTKKGEQITKTFEKDVTYFPEVTEVTITPPDPFLEKTTFIIIVLIFLASFSFFTFLIFKKD